jgi:SecD/SecF fusion protein
VTSGTVAAFLTILGYSLYDTIIVFDRIRENLPRMPRAAFSQIVNRSMSEVLTRSLATSFSTLIGVACLLIFGGATLKDFAFAMLIGIASGTYSSIFIASPVLTAWKEQEPELRARRQRIATATGAVPAFMEELPVAKLDGDEDLEPEAVEEEPAPASEPQLTGASKSQGRRSQAEILRDAGLGVPPELQDGDGDGDGDGAAADEPTSEANGEATAKPKDESKRRRQRRRKHGRRR